MPIPNLIVILNIARFTEGVTTSNLKFSFWTLDVTRTAFYDITLVRSSVRLSVRPSVTKFSSDCIISFFRYCT